MHCDWGVRHKGGAAGMIFKYTSEYSKAISKEAKLSVKDNEANAAVLKVAYSAILQPLKDVDAYRLKLEGSVYKSTILMKPVFEAAKTSSRKIVFAEGEDERTLRTALALLEETNDKPILIGRPEVVENRIERYGLPLVH